MRMFIKSGCLLFVILCGFSVRAQQQWKIARLVTTNSDTIKGQVLFEDWDISPNSIQFKDETGIVSRKSAQEIRSFSIEDPRKYFESKNVVLAYYSKNAVKEGKSPIIRTDSTSVFLEILLQSALVTFYEVLDDEKNQRFFLQKDARLHELRNPIYQLAKGETSHVIKSEVYKSQLKYLLSECPNLETDDVRYTHSDIIKVLEKYLKYCKTDYQTAFQQKVEKGIVAFGATYRHAPGYADGENFAALNLLLFSKKKFNSLFVSIELGAGFSGNDGGTEDGGSFPYFGLYGGKYFGLGDWHPMIYTGLSNVNGPFDTGVGISHKRVLSASVSMAPFSWINDNFAWSFQLRVTPFSK